MIRFPAEGRLRVDIQPDHKVRFNGGHLLVEPQFTPGERRDKTVAGTTGGQAGTIMECWNLGLGITVCDNSDTVLPGILHFQKTTITEQ